MVEVIKIDVSSVGLRIDRWIKNNLSKIPQSLIEKDLRNGKIKINNKKVKSSYKLKLFDQIYLYNISYKNLSKKKKIFIPKDKMKDAKDKLKDGTNSFTKQVQKIKDLGRLSTKKTLPSDAIEDKEKE